MSELYHYGRSKRDGAPVGSGRYPLGSGRNGPPYPSNRKIKKGYKLTRYSTKKEDQVNDTTYAFSSKSKLDSKLYKDDLAKGKLGVDSNEVHDIYKISISTIKPSIIREGHQVVRDVMSKSKDKELKKAYEVLKNSGFFNGVLSANQRADILGKSDILNEARIQLAKGIHSEVYKDRFKFSEGYRNKGYDAVVDPEDYVYIYDDPLILVNPNNFKIIDVVKM